MTSSEISTELTRVREERDSYESQYRSLLSKLTQMRATLGDRLRADAEELDRRETQIDSLTAQVSDLTSTITTLKSELVSSNEEATRLAAELDAARKEDKGRANEGGLRELQEQIERVKLDAHSWETSALEERSRREEAESRIEELKGEVERARQAEAHHRQVAERESASASNLSAVLSEFQSTQESELSRALGDHRSQLDSLSTSLAEYKSRAESAEAQLSSSSDLASRSEKLEGQVKEKNLLIGKLRHEAVILNEHLTEALRRLRNDQSEANVDKRLVTNLLIQFITTPRADGKRYEMLNLIAGVLGWRDEERALAGLQRVTGGAGKGLGVGRPSVGERRVSNTSGVGGDESFSNLFVEFLLSEAEKAKGKDGEEGGGGTGAVLPSRLMSPGIQSPSKSSFDGGSRASGEDANDGSKGGGIGSYFGLSRGGHARK